MPDRGENVFDEERRTVVRDIGGGWSDCRLSGVGQESRCATLWACNKGYLHEPAGVPSCTIAEVSDGGVDDDGW